MACYKQIRTRDNDECKPVLIPAQMIKPGGASARFEHPVPTHPPPDLPSTILLGTTCQVPASPIDLIYALGKKLRKGCVNYHVQRSNKTGKTDKQGNFLPCPSVSQ